MNLPRLRFPVSRTRLEAAEKKVKAVETKLVDEVRRLEGLLDTMGDVDQDLPGVSRQGLFRQLFSTTHQDRDLSAEMRNRVLQNSHVAYALKGQAENLIETHLDFMLGDELKVESENEKLQTQLEELWTDERNQLDDEHENLARSLILEGELILEATLSEMDGHLELGWTDPLHVAEVFQDKRRRDAFLHLTPPTPNERPRRWFVLNNLTEQITIRPWPEDLTNKEGFLYIITETVVNDVGLEMVIGQKGVHGLAFFFAWNRPKGGKRGRSELTSVLDAIDAGDELIWSTVDIQAVKRMFLLHVKDKGIQSKAQARTVLKKYGLLSPPRNPKVIGTNKEVEINFLQHQAADSESWLAEELGIQVQGAKGFPESWRGRADIAGAGARAADFVPLRRLRRKQRRLIKVFKKILEVSLELQRRAGQEVAEGEFTLETIEVGGKDKQRGAEVLKAVSTALTQVSSIQGVKPELVNAVLIQALKEVGLEVADDLAGLPPELEDLAGQIAGQVEQLMSQKGRQDGEGNQDEDDRDRPGERTG